MAKNTNYINWEAFWDDFDSWFQEHDSPSCTECHRPTYNEPDWEDQKHHIQQMVEERLHFQHELGKRCKKKKKGKH